MKVIHIITKLELGGAQENTLYTLGHLDRTQFSGMLVAGDRGLLRPEAEAEEGYEKLFLPSLVREVRPLRDVQTLASLTFLLRKEMKKASASGSPAALAVHTHSSKAGILGRAAARIAGVPIVIHSIHGFGFHDRQKPAVRRFYLFLEKVAARWTTAFIAVSQACIDTGVKEGIFPAGNAVLIRSGIELERFRGKGREVSGLRESLGIPGEAKLVGMVACLKPQKNPVDFVRVAAIVSRSHPDTHFLLAGDGALRPQVEEAAGNHDLSGRFHLLGWRRDVERIMPALDVLVLTSLWEGLPRVFPQAMAAGRPVVAYGVDGAAEAVKNGVSGFLVDPGDYRTAARKVVTLLGDPAAADRMGREGRERAAPFDADLMVRQQEDLYRRLLSERIAR